MLPAILACHSRMRTASAPTCTSARGTTTRAPPPCTPTSGSSGTALHCRQRVVQVVQWTLDRRCCLLPLLGGCPNTLSLPATARCRGHTASPEQAMLPEPLISTSAVIPDMLWRRSNRDACFCPALSAAATGSLGMCLVDHHVESGTATRASCSCWLPK